MTVIEEKCVRIVSDWKPANAEERLARMEAIDEIRQLPHRYGLAVDSRDLEALAALFVSDVRVGKDLTGRAALAEWYGRSLERYGATIHFVGNHTIDVLTPDSASGVVYCRDELEVGGEWHIGMIQYWDDYRREDGQWFFRRRKLHRWYMADALTRPGWGVGVNADPNVIRTPQLPDAWPSWDSFWNARGRSPR
jgi:SnoaL-like domain